mmetsp:Transcript_25619/g.71584  ORF Transcript_25619/g.71584 Transcript_25619/m.71584 type:complete len:314 (+) Transcript_25619:1372-2313(+)
MTRSAENPKQANDRSSSRVIGPVVSCDPTVVIFGSQYCPGTIPSPSCMPQAFPTIFWAKVKPSGLAPDGGSGMLKMSSMASPCPSASRALLVNPRPMMSGMRPPARTSSRMTLVFSSNSVSVSPFLVTIPSYGWTVMTSPMFISPTSNSIGSAPESSMVLKKIGAIFPPRHSPPDLMFGTYGMSSPMNHKTELVADFLDDPVPTTSPTYANGCPFLRSSSICPNGPISPSTSGTMPSRAFLSMASACSGMSGRDQASCAGLRSSVLVSPVTLKTVVVISLGTSGFLRYHSALAQLVRTFMAAGLPSSASALMS